MDFNKIFHKVPVQVQNRSAFQCSHKNIFSAKTGQLQVMLCDPVIPNTTIDLGFAAQVQLPPLATDFYGSIYAKVEAFFVPNRIVWAGWKQFMTSPTAGDRSLQQNQNVTDAPSILPYIEFSSQTYRDSDAVKKIFEPGELGDMLGFKSLVIDPDESTTDQYRIYNILPFLAYHKIYDDWYRDSRIQQPIYREYLSSNSTTSDLNNWHTLPFSFYKPVNSRVAYDIELFSLRQRNWQRDYFTNATPLPQAGLGASVRLADGETFTIAALRAANSLQQWFERNNIAGDRYSDQIKARFGVYPSDAVTDRAIYLGSKTFQVYNKSVYETVPTTQDNAKNPFSGQLGAKASSVSGFGEDCLVKNYTVTEHGHIFLIYSLVPEVLYSSGTRRYLRYETITDFPDPLLQGVGDQEIYSFEVGTSPGSFEYGASDNVFGYTQRFSEAKFMNDEVHGLLRDGQSLSPFALQRFIEDRNNNVQISSEFIEIPQDYLDQVAQVENEISNYGCWVESYIKYTKIQPLAAYSIPTLGDPRDTHTEVIDNGGTRL